MTLADAIPLYGAILTTLTILVGSVKYLLSSKIKPIEDDIQQIILSMEKCKTCHESINKSHNEKIEEVKKSFVNDVKEISKENHEFRIKYGNDIGELRLLLSEKYIAESDFDKRIEELKKRIEQNNEFHQLHHDVNSILQSIDSIKQKGGK